MKVYPSDVKDWDAELGKAGKHPIQLTHPYDLEHVEDQMRFATWLLFWWARIIWEFVVVLK